MNFLRVWLYTLLGLVFAMVIVGGLTRLTDSGLSITEWKPLTGAIPPLSEGSWIIEFKKYQAIPEFKLQNSGMSMSEFQFIYWWEWGHRQLGRLIGVVWITGFLLLWLLKKFENEPVWPSFLIGCLIGVQGGIGWWMVSSGLQEGMLDVASYRLAIHLLTAFLIISLIFWRIQMIKYATYFIYLENKSTKYFYYLSVLIMIFFYLQIFSGALVAGIDAGTAYNEWPLMAGEVIPDEAFDLKPFWVNFLQNSALVQFNHRTLGYLLLFLVLSAFIFAVRSRNSTIIKSATYLFGVTFFQVILGIVTILNEAKVLYAALHQVGGVLFLLAALHCAFLASRRSIGLLNS